MKLTKIRFYDGARDKTCRLGMADLFLEVQQILLDIDIRLLEKKDANGAAHISELIDDGFAASGGWKQKKSGGVDWMKEIRIGDSFLSRLGVEVQVSARSDLLIRDVVHLRNSLQEGEMDVGLIVVPDDRLQRFPRIELPVFQMRYATSSMNLRKPQLIRLHYRGRTRRSRRSSPKTDSKEIVFRLPIGMTNPVSCLWSPWAHTFSA